MGDGDDDDEIGASLREATVVIRADLRDAEGVTDEQLAETR